MLAPVSVTWPSLAEVPFYLFLLAVVVVDAGLFFAWRSLSRTHSAGGEVAKLAEEIPQIVWVADASGHPIYFNRRWREYTGLGPAQKWSALIHADDLERCREKWQLAKKSGSSYEVAFRFLRPIEETYRWHLEGCSGDGGFRGRTALGGHLHGH